MTYSEVIKYLIPAIGATYFTSTMTYMIGITKGKSDMYNKISAEYNLIPKNKDHFLYESRSQIVQNTFDYGEHLG
jgi:hypothetical protein